MRLLLLIVGIFTTSQINLFAAEVGMPQLDTTYWASQAFWLIIVFSILYISIAKFYLPKIKDNLDERENKIKPGETIWMMEGAAEYMANYTFFKLY